MTAPVERRNIKVSPEVHARIYRLAEQLGCASADQAIDRLFGKSAVVLSLTDVQHERWQAYADAAGVPLDQWVVLRCEAAMQYGTDKGSIGMVLDHVRALTQAAGIEVMHRGVPVRVRRPATTAPPTQEN